LTYSNLSALATLSAGLFYLLLPLYSIHDLEKATGLLPRSTKRGSAEMCYQEIL